MLRCENLVCVLGDVLMVNLARLLISLRGFINAFLAAQVS